MSEEGNERKRLKAESAAKKAEAKALRPWFKKKRFIITTAFIILGIFASASGGGNSTSDSANSNNSSSSKSSTVGIGKEVRDGKFAFTVNSIKCGVTRIGSYYFTSKPQGKYCVLDVLVKNIGKEAQSVNSDHMYLYDVDDRKFSTSNEAMLTLPNSDLWYKDINPGNFVNGQLVFDLPVGVSPTKAELHDSMFSDGVIVDLK